MNGDVLMYCLTHPGMPGVRQKKADAVHRPEDTPYFRGLHLSA